MFAFIQWKLPYSFYHSSSPVFGGPGVCWPINGMQDVGASGLAGGVGGAVVLVEGMDDHHSASLSIKSWSGLWIWSSYKGIRGGDARMMCFRIANEVT